jgi:hypothetical protein
MIGDGFSVWSFILSRLASSSITKSVPEPLYGSKGDRTFYGKNSKGESIQVGGEVVNL